MTGSVSVRVSNLQKKYSGSLAVDDVSFEIEAGRMLVLLGPSGCGKTTTLRCIGGLERADAGEIAIGGELVTSVQKGVFLQPEARGLGMVAQSYAIWPHMTVFDNVAFPLRMRKEPPTAIESRVHDALNVVRLTGLARRNATDLSGGQQQRVALARAIVGRPKVLLFDEPLSNLDAKLREQMRFLIKEIQREIKITAVYVTHDQAEAMGLGDELIVMNGGKIIQRGQARELYCEPKTRFVAEFIGIANILRGVAMDFEMDKNVVRVAYEDRVLQCRRGATVQRDVVVVVRPEWITLHRNAPPGTENLIQGRVRSSQYLGERTEIVVATGHQDFRVTADGDTTYPDGTDVFLSIDGERSIALPVE